MELVKVPSELLRQKSKKVKKIDSIRELAKEMVDFLHSHSNDEPAPIAVSAPQLGALVRVIAFRYNASPTGDIQVLINPTLVYAKGFHVVPESCLSLPGKVFTLRRAKLVKIRGLTLDGVERSFRGRDILAQVFEHELGHLDGILIDQIGSLRR
ncbi:unnamed protein product [marine sediment metagenome]|uniref:Peptide deformylase n=1 Tax=marine sediment metagenome TaxID=412755 RepID=X1P239_9ZZZZ